MGADVDPLRRYTPGQFMLQIVDLFGPPSGIAPQGEIVSWEAIQSADHTLGARHSTYVRPSFTRPF